MGSDGDEGGCDGAGTEASRDEHLQVLDEVRCSGRYGVTEFVVERTINFASPQVWSVRLGRLKNF